MIPINQPVQWKVGGFLFVAHLDEQNSSCPSWVGQVLCGMKNGLILGQCFNKNMQPGHVRFIEVFSWHRGFQSVCTELFFVGYAVMPIVSRGGVFIAPGNSAFFAHPFKRWLFGSGNLTQNPLGIHPTLGGLDWFNATWIGRKPWKNTCHLL